MVIKLLALYLRALKYLFKPLIKKYLRVASGIILDFLHSSMLIEAKSILAVKIPENTI